MEIFVFTEALGEPGVLFTRVVPSREGMRCLLSTWKAGRCVYQSGGLCSICAVIDCPSGRSSPEPYCEFVFLHSHSIQPVFMDFTKRFLAFTSNPSLAYFVPQKDIRILSCARRFASIITRVDFHQIGLYLSMPKIN